nr:hypothetical protein [uncultured Sphingosinicella sp.]
MPAPASTILRDAEWLAHRYDPIQDAFHFRHVPRSRHAEVPFLTDECLGEASLLNVLARASAAGATPDGTLHFIFHSAFCASTMLVRALDVPGRAMGLSEPVVLNDLVGWRRRGAEPGAYGRVLADVLRQLARPFEPGEAVVVKPSNVLNPLAAAMLTLRPTAKAILLYAPLPVFLASVARKGLWCRLWVRELLEGQLRDGLVHLGFEPGDYFRQSDLQVAAVGWLAQHALFAQLAKRFPGRVVVLDSDRLTNAPAVVAAEAALHFELSIESSAIADHPAVRRDSKSGGSFTAGQRDRDQADARLAYGDELEKVEIWARSVAANAGVELSPGPVLSA